MVHGYTAKGQAFSAAYDAENRMVALCYTNAGVVFSNAYRYAASHFLAEMLSYTNGVLASTSRFVRHGTRDVQERSGTNQVTREYAWGLGLPGGAGGLLSLRQSGQDYSYLYDRLGNVRGVLQGDQTSAARYAYGPFGERIAVDGSLDQPIGYSGKRHDPDAGLLYYGYRFYLPGSGRWMTRDPIGERGGMNLYAFVGNNPINKFDPMGLFDPFTAQTTTLPPEAAKFVADYMANFESMPISQGAYANQFRQQAWQDALQAAQRAGLLARKCVQTTFNSARTVPNVADTLRPLTPFIPVVIAALDLALNATLVGIAGGLGVEGGILLDRAITWGQGESLGDAWFETLNPGCR
jgi:RHS repeat-associated protein